MTTRLMLAALPLALTATPAWGKNDCDSPAANNQSVGTFSQLLDGQPGSPNQPSLTVTGGAGTGSDQAGATLSLTPGSKPFWCDMNLTLGLPGVTLVGDRAQIDDSYDIAWEQRWRADDATGPTFSTFVGIEIPVDSPGQNVQFTFEAVVARTVAKGETLYLDAIVQDDDGVRVRDWDAGFILGWRHDIGTKGVSFVLDGDLEAMAILRDGLAMPDFHLITGIDNHPVPGLVAAGAQAP